MSCVRSVYLHILSVCVFCRLLVSGKAMSVIYVVLLCLSISVMTGVLKVDGSISYGSVIVHFM